MNEKHTPGPWIVARRLRATVEGQTSPALFDSVEIPAEAGGGIALVRCTGQDSPNARLIAQAPMLYALVRAHALTYPDDAYADRIAQVIEAVEGKEK